MDEFTPHGFCLAWEPLLLWVTVVADAGIAWAYFGIPFLLLLAVVYRIAAVPSWLLIMFSAFILLCGAGHILDIITLWYPIYWTSAIEDLATALISLATFLLLPVGIAKTRPRRTRRLAGDSAAPPRSDAESSADTSAVTGAAELPNSSVGEGNANRKASDSDRAK
jgi:hypothetical protein